MTIRSNSILSPVLKLPTPSIISYNWRYGSILGVLIGLQLASGIFLRLHYTADLTNTFNSVIHITRDVPGGWVFRRIHANGASFIFFFLYLHLGRGLYYQSYKTQTKVWICGITIFLVTIGTAFLGYVLPWGQMSLWGATVITNLIRAVPVIGPALVEWVWGNFNVSQPTLNRFYSLHFLLPFVVRLLAVVHLYFLHERGSRRPVGDLINVSKINFGPYFIWKDVIGFVLVIAGLTVILLWAPNRLGDPENYIKANPIVTPVHIIPEWYFLFAYAILRVIPNKLGGVIALLLSIVIIYLLPLNTNFSAPTSTKKTYKFSFWMFVVSFLILTWLGGCVIEAPFENLSIVFSILYFSRFGALFFFRFFFSLYKISDCHSGEFTL